MGVRLPEHWLHVRPVFLTVLAAFGAIAGLLITALLARDPREAGAYLVACLMIGGAMAFGQRARTEAAPTGSAAQAATDSATPDDVRAVAHDLRAPLLTVSSYLDLIAEGAFGTVSDEARAAIRQCAAVTARAQTVVETTLRPRSREDIEAAGRVDLGRVMSDVLDALTSTMREHRAEVAFEGRLPAVRGDETALFRVFENLLQNAIKYGRPGVAPRVGISWRRLEAATIEVTVRDNGRGIRSDEAAAVLAPGVRGGNAAGAEGLGLGLPTAARLVARMGGTLAIDSRADAVEAGPRAGLEVTPGTVVRVTLPAA